MADRSKPGAKAPQYPISSVDSALRLLGLFRDAESLRLSDAASRLGVANSTAHRMLAMLAHHDFVRQDPETRSYVPGHALYELGLSVVQRMDVRTMLHPALVDLAAATGETMHSGVLLGSTVQYIDSVESGHALRVAGRTGMSLPAHCSALGKALLAHLEDTELHAIYPSEQLAGETERSLTTRSELESALVEVRSHGHALNVGESEDGVVAIGMAVVGLPGRAEVGISCAAPASRMKGSRIDEVAGLMRERLDAGLDLTAT